MGRIGVEEEFVLLDPVTCAPVPLGNAARDALSDAGLPGEVSAEFLTCQVEYATAPAATLADAGAQLRDFRRRLGAFAHEQGVIAAATGTPFARGEPTTVSPSARYAFIAEWLGHIAGGHQACGLHVHVEIPDAVDRLRALNAVRGWLPVLLAMSVNAPFRHGSDTGFGSWRTIMMRRLPTFGAPPAFADEADYAGHRDRLVRTGAAPDAASLAWGARISERYPTVEVRICDSQLDVDDTLLVAALMRGLLTADLPEWPALDTNDVNASLWLAARAGLDARLIDPRDGRVVGARELVEALVALAEPRLREHDDLDFVRERIRILPSEGTGADRQRAVLEAGGAAALAQRLDVSPDIAP